VKFAGRGLRILDFDLETLAAGFADPDWVPQKITCAAWSWVGSEKVDARISTQAGFFDPALRLKMLEPLLAAIYEADMLTGHNVIRFDLPVLNSECLRLGKPPLKPMLVQDTMRLPKTKGFKKGQDNISGLLGTTNKKQAMTWQEWEDAYRQGGWKEIISRCKSDVLQHKEMRQEMLERGWLRGPVTWRP
jgi:DNA polymerase elongation subunit (family B)